MAEIRKYNPKVTGEIDRALLAALGEDVRPVTPGSTPAPRSTSEPEAGSGAAAVASAPFGLSQAGGRNWLTVNPAATRPSEPDSVVDPDDVYPVERASRPTDDQPADFDEDYR